MSAVTEIPDETRRLPRVPSVDLEVWRGRLRTVMYGRDVGEPVSPHRVELPELTDEEAGGPIRRHARLVLSTLSGLAGGLIIAATAPVFPYTAPSWRLTLPGLPHPGSSFFSASIFIFGVVLMALGWVGLIGRAERQHGGEKKRIVMVAVVFAIWCVPVLLGPPLLSRDVYSYVAQGELASRGIDPTAHGPVYLGRGPIMSAADPVWRTNPAPYGPVAIEASKAIVEVTDHDASSAVWGFRALAMIGVIMTAVGVGLIAKSYRVSPAVAIAVGIANPLVLLHLIGGGHNDALMLGFMTLGLAAVRRDRRVLGVVLVALAVAIKLPAAIALVYIGWLWPGVQASIKQRVLSTMAVVASGFALVAAMCAAVGIGPGWILALQNTGKITSTFSVMTKLGYVAGDGANLIGLHLNADLVVALFRLVGMAVVGFASLLILLRSPKLGLVRSVGLVMILFIILGPVVWPWYLPAGFALLAAVGLGRYRPSYLVVCFAVSLLVWPTSVSPVYSLSRYQHLLGLGVVAVIAASAFGAQRLSDWTYSRRARRAGIDLDDPSTHPTSGPERDATSMPELATSSPLSIG